MNVLIVGSLHFYRSERVADEFKEACRHLGKALAESNHAIVVGSESKNTADFYIVDGANSVVGSHEIFICRPERGKTPYINRKEEYENIVFNFKTAEGAWPEARIPQILLSDGVILVGGGSGTLRTGYLAANFDRPVLAIPSFGGEAAKIWKDKKIEYQELGVLTVANSFFQTAWEERNGQKCVDLIEELITKYRNRKKNLSRIGIENKTKKSKIKVFISYAKEDKEMANRLFDDLKAAGLDAWLDSENLIPGQKWEQEINKAIKESSYFLALLSSNSLNKRGHVQNELKKAFEVADNIPSSEIFIIPVRLEDCQPAEEKLQALHWSDLFLSYDHGFKQILRVFSKTI